MLIRVLSLILVFITSFIPFANAQDRALPASQEEIQLSFAPLVKQVAPAVVNIYTKRTVSVGIKHPFVNDPFFGQFFGNNFGGRMRNQVQSALGSGVIIESNGLVVTNAHVIKGAEEITVGLSDGREFEAKLALLDEPSDLGLLRLDTKGEALPSAKLRPSETLEVGDLVLAIGNPFGVGQTVTSGIVSAKSRSSLDINDFNFFLQTDAAINPGNSGGPLVALDGGIVGINSAIYSRDGGSLGIGFAIPSEMVATVIAAEKSGISGEKGVTRPWLGITAQGVTSDIANSLDMKAPGGALVAALHSASPLSEAGIHVGDVILAINGHYIRDPQELKFRMATVPLGQSADFEVSRKGETTTHKVLAMAPPESPPRQETRLEGPHPFNGVTVANINPAIYVELGLSGPEEGVVITDLSKARGGLIQIGDIIDKINGQKISTVKSLQAVLAKPSPQGWNIVLNSGGQKRQILIR